MDCESSTRPISSNLGSVEAGESGLTCWTCFISRHLEVVAVAGLLWSPWCASGAAGFCGFLAFFSIQRTRPAANMRSSCLVYSLLVHAYRDDSYTTYTLLRLMQLSREEQHFCNETKNATLEPCNTTLVLYHTHPCSRLDKFPDVHMLHWHIGTRFD